MAAILVATTSGFGVPRPSVGVRRPSGPAGRRRRSCGTGSWSWRARSGASTEKVAELARLAFGKSSEKTSARQTPPAEQTAGEGGPDGAGAGQQAGRPPGRGRGQRKGSRGHGRRDYSHLPTREEIHDVPDGERVCPRCGADYVSFGEQCCELIDWQVQLVRVVIRRPTYRRGCRCPVRGVLAAPPAPKPIGKGRFTCGSLARLLVEKFVHGLW